MATQINSSTAKVLSLLLTGDVSPTKISVLNAVRLSKLGCLVTDDSSRLVVTPKAVRVLARFKKQASQSRCNSAVEKALDDILQEDGSTTQHRQLWVTVGQSEFSRDQVLTSLRSLRTEGLLRSFKSSVNNFQVFWARNEEAPAGDFEVNGE
jgi:hypothetical protein